MADFKTTRGWKGDAESKTTDGWSQGGVTLLIKILSETIQIVDTSLNKLLNIGILSVKGIRRIFISVAKSTEFIHIFIHGRKK